MGSHFKSVAKAVTWRVLGAADTFVLSFFVTGTATAACGIVGFELFTTSVLYYGHERAWENCSPIRLNLEGREAVRRARQCWPLPFGFRRNTPAERSMSEPTFSSGAICARDGVR